MIANQPQPETHLPLGIKLVLLGKLPAKDKEPFSPWFYSRVFLLLWRLPAKVKNPSYPWDMAIARQMPTWNFKATGIIIIIVVVIIIISSSSSIIYDDDSDKATRLAI